MGKDKRTEDEPRLPTFNNPTYESSETDNESSMERKQNKLADDSSLELKVIDYRNSDDSSSSYSTSTLGESSHSPCLNSTNGGGDPIEALRNLAREISPGITIAPIRKESMSDPDSPFNTSFPLMITRRGSTSTVVLTTSEKKRSSDESYWDMSLPTNHKRTASLFTNRQSYNEEVFDIDQILNISPKYFGFTRKQWITLFVFAFVNIFSAIVINLQAPFYPEIAQNKGASNVEIGLVFGSFEFIVFILSPIFGKYMNILGPKRVFNIGILVTGSCSILFGFLTFLESRLLFVTLSFIIRMTEAIGTAGHVTATFTLIAIEFPDAIFTVFASMETCSGLGLILGPLLGSVLFEAGSSVGLNFQFLLPFVCLGGILFCGALMAYFIMPVSSSEECQKRSEDNSEEKHGLTKLLKIPSVSLAAFSIFATAVSLGFNAPSLEPHIKQFNLENISKGAIFVINGGTYALTAPLIGKICDRTSNPKIIVLIGASLILGGYTLIGPAPFFPFQTILWVTCLGLFIQGLGLSCSFVSAFTQAMRDSLEAGFPDNVSTYGLVSGLWMSMFALGNCVGPSAAGFLTQLFNYRIGSMFVMALQILVVGISFIFIMKSNQEIPTEGNKDSELEIHDGSGVAALRQAKFYSEFTPPPPPLENKKENIKEIETLDKDKEKTQIVYRL